MHNAFGFSVTLSNQGPARRLKPVEKGVTIFAIHKLNDLNAEKNCTYY